MCFRPAGVARVMQCPECGAYNKPDATSCQKCGFSVPEQAEDSAPPVAAPGKTAMPPGNAPGAPTAPKAPGAPTAPKAPGAPKAPSTGGPKPPAPGA
jgi:hypothetical protein